MTPISKPLLEHAYCDALKKSLGNKESEILLDFVNAEVLEGQFYTRVPICSGHIRIDAACIEGEKELYPISVYGNLAQLRKLLLNLGNVSAWVFEIKEMLNFELLGQILTDMYYFARDYPNINVKGYGILCERTDKALETVCRHHGVRVFKADSRGSLP